MEGVVENNKGLSTNKKVEENEQASKSLTSEALALFYLNTYAGTKEKQKLQDMAGTHREIPGRLQAHALICPFTHDPFNS